MSLVDWIPGVRGLEAIAFATVVTFVGGVYVKQRIDVTSARKETAHAVADLKAEQAAHARDLALFKAAADAGTIANQSETVRRLEAQKEIDNESQRLETRARDAAVRAAAGDAGLRDAFAARPAAAGSGAGPGYSGSVAFGPASGPADAVRAHVFGWVDDAAGELALAADVARARGLACEREYGALTVPTNRGAP